MVLHSRTIGVLPILNHFIRRCRLPETLRHFLPAEDQRNRVDTATAILLLVRNILISREPIYGLPQWAADFIPELRRQMQLREVESLALYPEGRACRHPKARRVIDALQSLSRHRLEIVGSKREDLYTDATPLQTELIELLGLDPKSYGRIK